MDEPSDNIVLATILPETMRKASAYSMLGTIVTHAKCESLASRADLHLKLRKLSSQPELNTGEGGEEYQMKIVERYL